jgi:hypothetical protein
MLQQIEELSTNLKFIDANKKKDILEQKIYKVFSILRGKPSNNMKKLLNYIDKIINIFRPFIPCKEKCPNCCFIDVLISRIEISLIEKYINKKKKLINIKRNENVVKTIFEKEREKGMIFGELSGGKKCPFLNNNDECCIYYVRPYNCRKYVVFEKDNKKCGYNENNALQLKSELTDRLYKEIILYGLNKSNISNLYQELFEIRDCFYEDN